MANIEYTGILNIEMLMHLESTKLGSKTENKIYITRNQKINKESGGKKL